MSAPQVRIGTSGWSYDHWVDLVYPKGTPTRDRLEWYVKRFDTVEVNMTYYRWPNDSIFAGWQKRLPEGFEFTVKAPGLLTHSNKLLHPEEWVEKIKRGLHELGEKRGPLLVQLPPSLQKDIERLDYFLKLMTDGGQRVAMELRHISWNSEDVFETLERHNAAYCVMSGARLPCVLRATADFVYIRLHGPDQKRMYSGSYPDDDMHWWADRIREWTDQKRDVYVYFNNDYEGHAIRNGETLRRFLTE